MNSISSSHNKSKLAVFHPKHQGIVFAFFMALIMSGFMSFVILLINLGFIDQIIHLWLKAWATAFVVAFPTVLTIAPLVRRISMALIREHA